MVELVEKVSYNVPYVVSVQFTRIGIVTASVKTPAGTGTPASADIDVQVRYIYMCCILIYMMCKLAYTFVGSYIY